MLSTLSSNLGSLYLSWKKKVILYAVSFTGGFCFLYLSSQIIVKFKKEELKKTSLNENLASYIYLEENTGFNFKHDSEKKSWFPWKEKRSPLYWKLLQLSKSKHRTVRHKAVKSLSEILKLEKWQYMMVAQVCDVRTAVGLARMKKNSSLFFLPPPFKDLEKGNLNEDLLLLLFSVSQSNVQSCIELQIKQAKSIANILSKLENTWHLELEDQTRIYHSLQKKKTIDLFHKICLEVLVEFSATKSFRNTMSEKGIFKLLLKILKHHENDIVFESLIAQILANLSLEENFSNIIHISGWLGILSKWARSPVVKVSLPALKALANLDRDDVFYSQYDDGIYILHPTVRQSVKTMYADVIFVHGLLGATFWTWRQSDDARFDLASNHNKRKNFDESISPLNDAESSNSYTWCWPRDWLAADFKDLRLIAVDYQTCVSNWSCKCPQEKEKDGLDVKAKELTKKLLLAHVGDRPIIWVAHSMGGLLVKQILVEAASSNDAKVNLLAKKTVGLAFYSVPHKGSEIATLLRSVSRIFLPSIDMIQLQKGSPYLLQLHEKFKDFVLKNNIPILSFGETKTSPWNLTPLVPLDSSNPGFGDFFVLPVDHLSTCKPLSVESIAYTKFLDFLLAHIPGLSTHTFQPRRISKKLEEISNLMSLVP